jgi:hypothetical protein
MMPWCYIEGKAHLVTALPIILVKAESRSEDSARAPAPGPVTAATGSPAAKPRRRRRPAASGQWGNAQAAVIRTRADAARSEGQSRTLGDTQARNLNKAPGPAQAQLPGLAPVD